MSDIKITMVGMGYVGLVTGAAFAKHGFDTTCTTTTKEKAERLNNGISPFYEPGLDGLVKYSLCKSQRYHLHLRGNTVIA
jgi:UDPglucose 6-dehydrogenase